MCTVLVTLDYYDVYWVPFPCEDKVARKWFCADLSVSRKETHKAESTLTGCDFMSLMIHDTCYTLLTTIHVSNNQTRLFNITILKHVYSSSIEHLLITLAQYGVKRIIIVHNNKSVSFSVTPTSDLCHSNTWDVEMHSAYNSSLKHDFILYQRPSWDVSGCSRGQHQCLDGTCIPETKVCNGVKDCQPSGDDEENCWCLYHNQRLYDSVFCRYNCTPGECTCAPMYFQCWDRAKMEVMKCVFFKNNFQNKKKYSIASVM